MEDKEKKFIGESRLEKSLESSLGISVIVKIQGKQMWRNLWLKLDSESGEVRLKQSAMFSPLNKDPLVTLDAAALRTIEIVSVPEDDKSIFSHLAYLAGLWLIGLTLATNLGIPVSMRLPASFVLPTIYFLIAILSTITKVPALRLSDGQSEIVIRKPGASGPANTRILSTLIIEFISQTRQQVTLPELDDPSVWSMRLYYKHFNTTLIVGLGLFIVINALFG